MTRSYPFFLLPLILNDRGCDQSILRKDKVPARCGNGSQLQTFTLGARETSEKAANMFQQKEHCPEGQEQ